MNLTTFIISSFLSHNIKMELSNEEDYRDLVICNRCLWSASLLRGPKYTVCPNCGNDRIEIVPVGDRESYNVRIANKGVEIDFDIEK
jgi:hypothetical protein